VAAYRTSIETGKSLSERKLAQMFGKTSRRWARSRMVKRSPPWYPPRRMAGKWLSGAVPGQIISSWHSGGRLSAGSGVDRRQMVIAILVCWTLPL
jgi:hypothetical protein